MARKVLVSPSLLPSIRQVLTEHPADLATVETGDADLECREGPGRPYTDGVLTAGGTILCAEALALAERLDIPSRTLGALLDALHVKVRSCSLGCF